MPEQDIAKGIAILLVITFHTITLHKSIYILLSGLFGFVLPFFFFMAGYNHRPGRYTYRQVIRRRARQILLPSLLYFLVISVVGGAYYVLSGQLSIASVAETSLLQFLSRPLGTMLGLKAAHGMNNCLMMFWFIQMLFTASLIFYAVADHALSSGSRMISVTIGLIVVTMIFARFNLRLPFYLSGAPAVASIMLLGAFFGQQELLTNRRQSRRIILINALVAYAAFIVPAATFRTGFLLGGAVWGSSYDTGREWTVILCVLFAVAGSYPFVHFCRLLIHTGPLAKGLCWCGNHSMQLLFLHNVVQLLICAALGIEPFRDFISSEINDFRTLGVLALEVLVCVLLILAMEKLKKRKPA